MSGFFIHTYIYIKKINCKFQYFQIANRHFYIREDLFTVCLIEVLQNVVQDVYLENTYVYDKRKRIRHSIHTVLDKSKYRVTYEQKQICTFLMGNGRFGFLFL